MMDVIEVQEETPLTDSVNLTLNVPSDQAIGRRVVAELASAVRSLLRRHDSFDGDDDGYTLGTGVLRLGNDEDTSKLCSALEALFLHGLKSGLMTQLSWLFAKAASGADTPTPCFWDLLLAHSHRDLVKEVSSLNQIRTDVGRCRAWIRLTLNQATLHSYWDAIARDGKVLRMHYLPHAVLRDADAPDIVSRYLRAVDKLRFNVAPNSSLLNQWTPAPLVLSGWAPAPPTPLAPGVDVAAEPDLVGKAESIVSRKKRDEVKGKKEEKPREAIRSCPVPLKIYDGTSIDADLESRVAQQWAEADLNRPSEQESCTKTSSSTIDINPRVCASSFETVGEYDQVSRSEMCRSMSSSAASSRTSAVMVSHVSMFPGIKHVMDESYDSIVQDYSRTVVSMRPASIMGTPEFRELLSPSIAIGPPSRESPVEDVPVIPTTGSSPEDEDGWEVVKDEGVGELGLVKIPREEDLSGDVECSPEYYMKRMGVICPESGLDKENFQCKACRRPVGMIYGKERLCKMDGRYYCYECHEGATAVIPARVIHNWDFNQYPVSNNALEFLRDVNSRPVIDLKVLNPLLYLAFPDVEAVRILRIQLSYIRLYLFSCRDSYIAQQFRSKLWPRDHLYEHINLYSVFDLTQIYHGQLQPILKKALAFGEQHVKNCDLCRTKGFIFYVTRYFLAKAIFCDVTMVVRSKKRKNQNNITSCNSPLIQLNDNPTVCVTDAHSPEAEFQRPAKSGGNKLNASKTDEVPVDEDGPWLYSTRSKKTKNLFKNSKVESCDGDHVCHEKVHSSQTSPVVIKRAISSVHPLRCIAPPKVLEKLGNVSRNHTFISSILKKPAEISMTYAEVCRGIKGSQSAIAVTNAGNEDVAAENQVEPEVNASTQIYEVTQIVSSDTDQVSAEERLSDPFNVEEVPHSVSDDYLRPVEELESYETFAAAAESPLRRTPDKALDVEDGTPNEDDIVEDEDFACIETEELDHPCIANNQVASTLREAFINVTHVEASFTTQQSNQEFSLPQHMDVRWMQSLDPVFEPASTWGTSPQDKIPETEDFNNSLDEPATFLYSAPYPVWGTFSHDLMENPRRNENAAKRSFSKPYQAPRHRRQPKENSVGWNRHEGCDASTSTGQQQWNCGENKFNLSSLNPELQAVPTVCPPGGAIVYLKAGNIADVLALPTNLFRCQCGKDGCNRTFQLIDTSLLTHSKAVQAHSYIAFGDKKDAREVVRRLGGRGCHIRLLEEPELDDTKIYVANLPPSVTEKEISYVLKDVGLVSSVKILRDSNGVNRGVGFIRMSTEDQAVGAIQFLHDRELIGCDLPLQARLAYKYSKKVQIERALKTAVGITQPENCLDAKEQTRPPPEPQKALWRSKPGNWRGHSPIQVVRSAKSMNNARGRHYPLSNLPLRDDEYELAYPPIDANPRRTFNKDPETALHQLVPCGKPTGFYQRRTFCHKPQK
ncbi:unnamed protein product [Notodromas monacha]|uniref:RRM domain-containing protein n=1 Tax=Notodromas monacha TaxID=399045 RepID=A0A7R9BW86_9CRUS|nr:unnamed protein product [Notodromas monacha]CAG0922545.1 unnamed protein product [Notodromas monacha]